MSPSVPALTVLAVPGVGLWPGSFDRTLAALELGPTIRTEIAVRPTGRLAFEDQVAHLADRCEAGPTLLVGVSGGATLALGCAVAECSGLVAVVSHEPLIGPLEPVLHARVEEAGRRLRAESSMAEALSFVAALYGRGWNAAPPEAALWAERHYETICEEVSHFASFHPRADQLQLGVPHLTTVGEHSGPERHRVAEFLGRMGATTTRIENSGHLVLVEQPTRFAATIRTFADRVLEKMT